MGRRGNGEGSISRRKDGRWMGRYTVHTARGPKQRAVYGRTRAEAAEKLTKAMAEGPRLPPRCRQTNRWGLPEPLAGRLREG